MRGRARTHEGFTPTGTFAGGSGTLCGGWDTTENRSPGTARPERREDAAAPSRRARTGTGGGRDGLRTGTGDRLSPDGPAPREGCASVLPHPQTRGSRDGVPGLSRDCGPLCALGCPRTLPLPCSRGCPGRSRHSTPPCARGCPGRSRAVPGPRSLRAPGAVPGHPGLFRDLFLLAPGAVPGRAGLPPLLPVPAERVRGAMGPGGEGGGRHSGCPPPPRRPRSGHGAGAQPPAGLIRAVTDRPGAAAPAAPIRGAAAPPLPIVRARTRGGPARRDRPMGTLRAAPIRGKGLEDAPGC